jgi:hypothetical protein
MGAQREGRRERFCSAKGEEAMDAVDAEALQEQNFCEEMCEKRISKWGER